MWDSREETEAAPPSATTAGAVIAQNAELAHGVACVIAPTAGPDRWKAICCSQLAGVTRWTCSHNNGRPTGNIWPLSSSVAITLMTETFIGATNIRVGPLASRYPRWDGSYAPLTLHLGIWFILKHAPHHRTDRERGPREHSDHP